MYMYKTHCYPQIPYHLWFLYSKILINSRCYIYMKLCYFSYLLHHSWELLHHLLLKLRVTSKHWIWPNYLKTNMIPSSLWFYIHVTTDGEYDQRCNTGRMNTILSFRIWSVIYFTLRARNLIFISTCSNRL